MTLDRLNLEVVHCSKDETTMCSSHPTTSNIIPSNIISLFSCQPCLTIVYSITICCFKVTTNIAQVMVLALASKSLLAY